VLVLPSPKVQAYPLTVPVEPLVKVTAKEAVPEAGVAVKLATGAAVATEMVLVVVLLPKGQSRSGQLGGSRSASDLRINELGEGLSSNMTILSEGAEWVMGQETSGIIGSLSSNLNPEGCPNESFARTHRTCHA